MLNHLAYQIMIVVKVGADAGDDIVPRVFLRVMGVADFGALDDNDPVGHPPGVLLRPFKDPIPLTDHFPSADLNLRITDYRIIRNG